MTKYYFARHGESTANVDHVAAGWSDVPLTERGRQQAHDTADEIYKTKLKFDKILSSPLSRALDTAKIIAEVIGYPVEKIVVLDDLKEKTVGCLELGPPTEVYNKTEEEMAALGGENAEMFRNRVRRVIKEIRQITESDDNILVVAHAGIYKASVVIADNKEPATEIYNIEPPKNAALLEYPIDNINRM